MSPFYVSDMPVSSGVKNIGLSTSEEKLSVNGRPAQATAADEVTMKFLEQRGKVFSPIRNATLIFALFHG